MDPSILFARVVSGEHSTAGTAWRCMAALLRSPFAQWVAAVSEVEGVGPPFVEKELPRGEISIFIDLADDRRVLDPSGRRRLGGTAWVSGPHVRPIVTASGRRSWLCFAELTAEGAYRVLGISPSELLDCVVPLEDVLGVEARRLTAQVQEAAGARQRLELLAGFLVARAAGRAGWDPVVDYALRRLNGMARAPSVESLAREVGWSRKHLHRRLVQLTGFGAGRWLQLTRFRASLLMLHQQSMPSLAHVAHALEYADQAHFSREFRELADMTPTEYLRSRALNLDWGYARLDMSH
jgi:AraC-like DNA-binding protein